MPNFSENYFNSSTGKNKIRYLICKPDSEPKALVQIMHGIAEYIDRYKDFMEFLASNGIVAVGTDHLGHGKSIEAPEQQGFFAYKDGWDYVIKDEEILRGLLKEEYPGIPFIVFGHSMGSFMARTSIIKYPDAYNAAIISGTGNQGAMLVFGGLLMGNITVAFKGAHHYSTFLNNIAFGSYNKIYENAKTDYDWLSRDEAVVQKYIDDPLCGFLPSCSLFRDMMVGVKFITDVSKLPAMNKDMPVCFMSGAMDPVGECGKGVQKAYDNFVNVGMKDVSIKLYPEGRHEMLNELNSMEVYSDILNWIESKI